MNIYIYIYYVTCFCQNLYFINFKITNKTLNLIYLYLCIIIFTSLINTYNTTPCLYTVNYILFIRVYIYIFNIYYTITLKNLFWFN